MRYLLLFIGIMITPSGYSQSSRVINFPLELIYKKYLKECLEVFGPMQRGEWEELRKTFVSTPEFNKRFICFDFYQFLDFYGRKDVELWKIDLAVSNYFDSLSKVEPPIIEVDSEGREVYNSADAHREFSKMYKIYSEEKLGKLVFIDYSNIRLDSPRLVSKLTRLGLRKEEIDRFVGL